MKKTMRTLQYKIWEVVRDYKYFRISGLRRSLGLRRIIPPSSTLHATIKKLRQSGKIFDVGRGWYSTIAVEFTPDNHSVKDLVCLLRDEFPNLPFSCWSTEQLQPYAHHMMTRFVSFVYAETDVLPSIAEYLDMRDYRVFRNPTKSEIAKFFSLNKNTCILRPSISEEPKSLEYAVIEKILVDLHVEFVKINLMEQEEYLRLFSNLVMNHRINMAKLFRYAQRREISDAILFNELLNKNQVLL
jgi:hypothetical protein